MLGQGERLLHRPDRLIPVAGERECTPETRLKIGDDLGRRRGRGEGRQRLANAGDGLLAPSEVVERIAEPRGHPCGLDDAARPEHERQPPSRSDREHARATGRRRHPPRQVSEPRPFAIVRAQVGGSYIGGLGRLRGPDRRGPLGGKHVGAARLGTQVLRVRILPGGLVGVEEVGGNHLGHLCPLVGECGAKVHGGPHVPGLSLGSRQQVIGNGPDERLGEDILAAFGRELLSSDRQYLFSHEGGGSRRDGPGPCPRSPRSPGEGSSAQHRALLHDTTFVRIEGVETRRDEGCQPRWSLELTQFADEVEGVVVGPCDDALVQEPSHRLDGVEGDAIGTLHDPCPRAVGKARDEAIQQLAHDLAGERVDREARNRSAGEHESLALSAFRSRQHEKEDGTVTRPFEEMVQEVDHAGIGPLQVLDDHHDRQML